MIEQFHIALMVEEGVDLQHVARLDGMHPEIEFYLFEKQDDWSKSPTPIDEGGYFDHVPRSPGMDRE